MPGTAIHQLTSLCQEAKNKLSSNGEGEFIQYEGESITKEEFVKRELNKWLLQEESGTSETDYGYIAKKMAVEYIIQNGYVELVFNEMEMVIDGSVDAMSGFKSELQKLRLYIIDYIKIESQEISAYKTAAIASVKDSISKGSDSLKEAIDSSLDGFTGGSTTGGLAGNAGSANTTATFFSFAYSDYLQLFLIIALLGNQEGVILRMSDVIEANMKMHAK